MICILVFTNHGLIFVLVKKITTVVVLKHLIYIHLTNFEFVGVCMDTSEDHHLWNKLQFDALVIFYNLSQKLLLFLIIGYWLL